MIHIVVAGFSATVQDVGREGHLREGVPRSGPADPVAFRAACSLVGNTDRDAAIEIAGLPFAFRCDDARIVAVTGREVSVVARDRLPAWTAVFVRAGDVVRVGGTPRTRYAYVAVSGGIASEEILGSRSAYPRAGLGRTLRAGDAIALGTARRGAEDAGGHVPFEYGGDIAAVAGPHHDRFDAAAQDAFFASPFTVAPESDRQGVRLE